MTGYEIRNAMRREYGFDAAGQLFDPAGSGPGYGRRVLQRLKSVFSMAMMGVA